MICDLEFLCTIQLASYVINKYEWRLRFYASRKFHANLNTIFFEILHTHLAIELNRISFWVSKQIISSIL